MATKHLRLRNKALSWAASLLLVWGQGTTVSVAQTVAPSAAPQGGHVVGGSAGISQTTNTTTINQSSNRAIINWQSFNVGSQQTVRFQQPSAQSMTLNRVVTPDPSVIAGRITANGGIALVNQSGVFFAHGAKVQAQSVIVSTADISNRNFMAGGAMNFNKAGKPDARIVNNGDITIKQAGLAALVAPQVVNHGVIQARLGTVILAGAETHTIDLNGDGLVSFDVTGAVHKTPNNGEALVTNTGVVRADGGTVELTAAAADGIVQNLVRAGGHITANTDAATGTTGHILLEGTGGSISVAGNVSAQGKAAGTQGGTIDVIADRAVQVESTARINASGKAGGGTIGVGTTLPGAVTARLAQGTGIAKGAVIKANATAKGNGGHVVVNSSMQTAIAGSVSARGGRQGGDGGVIELSGQGGFALFGKVDAGAPAGQLGSVVLDPDTLTVVADGDPRATAGLDSILLTGTLPYNFDAAGADFITQSQINNITGSLTLQATTQLDVDAAINKGQGDLNLETFGALNVNAAITLGNGNLELAGMTITINAIVTVPVANQVVLTPQSNPDGAALGPITVSEGEGGSIIAGTVTSPLGQSFFSTINLTGPNQINTVDTLEAVDTVTVVNTKSLDVTGEVSANTGVAINVQGGDLTIDGFVQSGAQLQMFASGNVTVGTEGSVIGENVAIAAGYNFNTNAPDPTAPGSITINGLVLGGSEGDGFSDIEGSVSLSAGTGGITQGPLGSLQASTLTVRSGGDVVLTALADPNGNGGNTIGTLGASNVQGNFSLSASGIPGEGPEPIFLDGDISVSGTFNLQAIDTNIIQNDGSRILAGTLIAGANGDISMTGANQVNVIGEIDAFGFTFHNVTDLQVAGPISPIFDDVTIATDGNLLVTGSITVEDSALVLQAGGNLTVAASAILSGQPGDGGTAFVSLEAATPTAGFSSALPGALTIAGVVSSSDGLTLQAGTGGINQTGGNIAAATLLVQSGGNAFLNGASTGTPNSITDDVAATVAGDFELDNGTTDIVISTAVTASTIGLRTTGFLNLGGGCPVYFNCIPTVGTLNAGDGSGRISLQVGALTVGSTSNTITGGLVEIASATRQPLIAGDPTETAVTGSFMVNQDVLANITSTTLRLGAATFDGATTTTATNLTLGGAITLPNGLDLQTLGDITQADGATFNVGTISGAAGGNVALTLTHNLANTVGDFRAGNTLNLMLAAGMTIAGTIQAPSVILQSVGDMTETGAGRIVANQLALTSTDGSVGLGGDNAVTQLNASFADAAFAFADTTTSGLIVPVSNTIQAGQTMALTSLGDLTINGTVTGTTTVLHSTDATLTVNGHSAIATDGILTLVAPTVVTNGLLSSTSGIVVSATTANLGGEVTGPILTVQAPSLTFNALSAPNTLVLVLANNNGTATGSLDALGLQVSGGTGATLTGSIAGITTGAAAVIGVRASATGIPLGSSPPNPNLFTFNGCQIGVPGCTVIVIPPPPPNTGATQPPQVVTLTPIGAATSPETLLSQLGPRRFDDTLTANVFGLPTPPPTGLFVQPARDASEDLELAPPNVRSEDY